MTQLVWWVVVGLVAGLLARWIFPGRYEPTGLVMTVVLGVVGAVVGGWIATALGVAARGTVGSILLATLGAVVVLWVYNAVRKP